MPVLRLRIASNILRMKMRQLSLVQNHLKLILKMLTVPTLRLRKTVHNFKLKVMPPVDTYALLKLVIKILTVMQQLITGQVQAHTLMCTNWMTSTTGQLTQASHVLVESMEPPTLHLAGNIDILRGESWFRNSKTVTSPTKV